MGLSEKLSEIKSQLDSLITYANDTTGESDTRIGDVVRTLVDGYGGGGIDFDTFPDYPNDPEADLWFTTWFPNGTKKVLNFINAPYTMISGTISNGIFTPIKTTTIGNSENYFDDLPAYCHHKLILPKAKDFAFKQGDRMTNDLGFYNNVLFVYVPQNTKITGIVGYAYTSLVQQKTLMCKMEKNLYYQNMQQARNLNELYIDGHGQVFGATTYHLFSGMYSLTNLTLKNVDFSANTGIYAFQNAYNLTNVILENVVLPSNGIYLDASRFITRESVINIFNALPVVSDKTVRLHAETKKLLSADDLAIATNKGYTIS